MSGAVPLLEAVAVRRVFRTAGGRLLTALDGVTLAVARGEFVAVTGPSGCGKTTLLSLLAAFDRPTGGTVRFDGADLGEASEAARARVRRRIGFVFQNSPLIAGLPVWENVTWPLVPHGVPARERRERARVLLEPLGLDARVDSRPGELSGGEQQRIGIARALVADPEALLADEPTSNIDRESARLVLDLLRERHAAGTTIVTATHDPALQSLATRTIPL